MTLLKIDGFEGYGRADVAKFWGSGSYADTSVLIGAQGRRGGNCIYSTTYNTTADYRLRYYPEDQTKTLIVGFAYKNTGSLTNNQDIFSMWNGGAPADPGIRITSSGGMNFSVVRQYGYNYQIETLLSFSLEYNNWYYFECKVKGGTSDGVFELRIDEVVKYSGGPFDTVVVNGTNTINFIDLWNGNYCYGYFDDVYILNTEGSVNNNFLGDVRVDAIHPNGDGNYSQMTPSAGNNYECVDETTFDDSDYVEDALAGNKDSYTYPNVPTDLDNAGIYGVQVDTVSKRTESTANRKMKNFLRTGSTDYEDAAAKDLLDTFESMNTIWEDDPSDSNPWTQAKINACEFGVEVN
jgi:hypothetical protein